MSNQIEAFRRTLLTTWQGKVLLAKVVLPILYVVSTGATQGWENPETQTDRDGKTLIGDVGLAETPIDAVIQSFFADATLTTVYTNLYLLSTFWKKYKEIRTTQGETLSNPEEPSAAARSQMEGNDERGSQKSKESWFRSPWSKREDPRPSEKTALVAATKGVADRALGGDGDTVNAKGNDPLKEA